jgi:heme-degrading monooxygenase HmoA
MIARIWHGTTEVAKADAYLEYLNTTGIPDYRNTKGNLGAYVLRRVENDRAHFLTLSFWESLDAIKSFAGEDPEAARYYPQDKEFLLEFEPTVQHYELFE